MREPDPEQNRLGRPRRLKLWHLVVLVLLSSVVLGGIKALSRGGATSGSAMASAVAGVWVLASASLLVIKDLSAKLGGRATQPLKNWGIARGGVVGFLVWVIGVFVNLVIVLGITVAVVVGVVKLILSLIR